MITLTVNYCSGWLHQQRYHQRSCGQLLGVNRPFISSIIQVSTLKIHLHHPIIADSPPRALTAARPDPKRTLNPPSMPGGSMIKTTSWVFPPFNLQTPILDSPSPSDNQQLSRTYQHMPFNIKQRPAGHLVVGPCSLTVVRSRRPWCRT